MADAVSLCNLALARLGARSISSLSEDSTAGRECNRVYAHARDSELRAHVWGFARTQVQVAADSTNPIFDAARRYLKPANCLRILPTEGQEASALQDDFQTYGRYIHTDHSSPINLIYIKQVTDENQFDELFTRLLVARIANDISEKVTQSNKKRELANMEYVAAKKEARKINSFEKPPIKPPEDKWVTARL
jgi:hypothetical protein